MTLLLKNGNVDVFIRNGEVAEYTGQTADRVIDCTGLTILPGIFDMHVHFRDPGQTHKEDIASGSKAALAGGVTAVLTMPNTTPVIDAPNLVGAAAPINLYTCAAITKGLQGRELTDFAALKAAGAVAVSDDGRPVESAGIMLEAMVAAEKAGLVVISHCEDLTLAEKHPRISENIATMREIRLAKSMDVPVHIAHVSTAEAIGYIRAAKKGAIAVTCEVAPHHFTLTDAELSRCDADYKMNPPLRGAADVQAIIRAIADGTVDCIASDHAPHSPDEKADFGTAPNGVLGLETILAVSLTRLYHTGLVTLERIVELLCVNPRKILGIPVNPADLVIVDLNEEWTVDPDKLKSKSKNTCFKGMTLKGRVKYTIINGEVQYDGA
jgi:dihydroorotase